MIKKFLLSALVFIIPLTSISAISCKSNNQETIYRPEPILPIQKQGFENVKLDSINIENIFYNIDLIEKINNQIVKAKYDLDLIEYKVFKNGLEISMNDDLYRNGSYKFQIYNKNNTNDMITASIEITNSKYLADNFKVKNIGTVYDNRPKTLMMGLMFYNMNMISEITSIGEQLTNKKNYTYSDSKATLKINDEVPTSKPNEFYGSIDLTYKVDPFVIKDENFPATIEEFVKIATNNQTKSSLGKISSTNKYVVLMQFITYNVANPKYWSLFINDLDLDNFKIEIVSENNYKMRINSKEYKLMDLPSTPEEQNKEYNDYSHYLDDKEGIYVTFECYE